MCAIVSPSVKQINTEGVKQAGILIDTLGPHICHANPLCKPGISIFLAYLKLMVKLCLMITQAGLYFCTVAPWKSDGKCSTAFFDYHANQGIRGMLSTFSFAMLFASFHHSKSFIVASFQHATCQVLPFWTSYSHVLRVVSVDEWLRVSVNYEWPYAW